MNEQINNVIVVDDDAEMRESITWILGSLGYSVQAFATADEYLRQPISSEPFCLLADLLLPGTTGLKLCREIAARQTPCSFIMISGNGDIPSAVEAMRLGAIDFLVKPFSRQQLLDAVARAIQKARDVEQERQRKQTYSSRIAKLSTREQEVLNAVASGLVTKEIASRMAISVRTVDVHRSRIMHKLGIESPLQLANIFAVIGTENRLIASKSA
jgi:FixJ family two-component response regulator